MRRLLDALNRLDFTRHVGFNSNVLGKYPDDRSMKHRLLVKKARCRLLDLFSYCEKLRHACATFCSFRPREFVKGGIANLTQHDLVIVQHGKPEGMPLFVMPLDFVTEQRHGLHSPHTDAGWPRLPQRVGRINDFTATLSRKNLPFLIALASIAFGVCSSAHATVAIDVVGTEQVSSSGTAFNYSGLTTGAGLSNGGIVATLVFNSSLVTGITATWGGQTMTQIGSCVGVSPGFLCLFGITGISNFGAQTLAISWGGTSTIVTVDAMSFTGVNQTTPFPHPNSATGTSTAPSVNITSSAGEYVIAAMNANSFPPNLNSVNPALHRQQQFRAGCQLRRRSIKRHDVGSSQRIFRLDNNRHRHKCGRGRKYGNSASFYI